MIGRRITPPVAMATTTNIPSPSPSLLLLQRFPIIRLIRLPNSPNSSPSTKSVAVKCSKDGGPGSGDGGSLRDALSGMLGERVEELLNREENRGLLDELEQASQRVETAKQELAEIEKQEAEAKSMRDYISRLESRASVIAECQKEILEARGMIEEAKRSLMNRVTDASEEIQSTKINQDSERVKSLKASFVSAVFGTLAEFPIALSRAARIPRISTLGITFISCVMFGVTFCYAIRQDLDNFQLKSGPSTAFGFVKGLGMLGAGFPVEMDANSILSSALDGKNTSSSTKYSVIENLGSLRSCNSFHLIKHHILWLFHLRPFLYALYMSICMKIQVL
ncbi:uncharacterized protein LOC127255404 isoform X1 [Andrographis paniculata]|uniref:uncharacterized protein LOC127255404 isoform X1 n=1 Tax=Andrographis paniculata TaxID=175694 RepID=UPI0021E8229A|nr:uncharacterized protein LOC127255404 isoform X1 [Andrographis paniculata]